MSSNKLHCPRCGKAFYVESPTRNELTSLGETMPSLALNIDSRGGEFSPRDYSHSGEGYDEFICSSCQFEFKMQYDGRRKVYFPITDLSLASLPEPLSNPDAELAAIHLKTSLSDPIRVRLKQKWQDVLEDFNHSEVHVEFIELCHKLDRLSFAEERYQYLKNAIGDDPEVSKRLRQIEIRSLKSQVVSERLTLESQVIPYWRRYSTIFIIGILFILTGTLLRSLEWLSFLGFFIIAGLLFHSFKK